MGLGDRGGGQGIIPVRTELQLCRRHIIIIRRFVSARVVDGEMA